MKKFFKFILIFIILIIFFLILNTIRNYYIINKIRNNEIKFFSDMSSYYIKIESHFSYTEPTNSIESKTTVTDVKEVYYKDNISLIKNYRNGQLVNIENNTDENVTNLSNSPTYTDVMKIDFIIKEDFSDNIIKLYLLNFIKTNNNTYIINGAEGRFYYNIDNGLLSKYILSDSRYEIYSIEKNNVTDSDMN